jgi:hypothetical protein
MSKEKSQIIGIDLAELKDVIQHAVRDEIESCLSECRFGTEYKDEIWNREAVANFLGVSQEKVTDLFNRKEIPGTKLGREYFFLKSQILETLNKRRA